MDSFHEIAGNTRIKEYFERAFLSDKIPHALLICGEKGSGKKMIARALAKRILCENPTGIESCGVCKSCKQFSGGNQPDVIYVGHEKSTIGVDIIRTSINQDIMIRPYSRPYKIYIMDEAEKMTVEAQNALLKTLEEPPHYGIMILLASSSSAFLQTILSRCVVLNVRPLSDDQVRSILEEKNLLGTETDSICALARGNAGKAMKLSEDEEFQERISVTARLLSQGKKMRVDEILAVIRKWGEVQDNVYELLDFLRDWVRDLLVLQLSRDSSDILLHSYRKSLENLTGEYLPGELNDCMQMIEETERKLRANVTYESSMEMLFLSFTRKTNIS